MGRPARATSLHKIDENALSDASSDAHAHYEYFGALTVSLCEHLREMKPKRRKRCLVAWYGPIGYCVADREYKEWESFQ